MPNRKQLARSRRKKETTALYLAGQARREIAKRLGVSLGTVGRDLSAADRDLKFQAADSLMRARQKQQAHAERMRAAAWESFERSKQPFKSQKQERGLVRMGDKEEMAQAAEGRVTLLQEERVGDPRFLQVALNVDRHEASLLGLYTQPEIGGDDIPVKPGDTLVIRVAAHPL